MEGYVENITKSWQGGGREKQGYIVLVRVPGVDSFEVGLAPLRTLLGLSKLTPEWVEVLMAHKPETITFVGKCHQCSYGSYNDLRITAESAEQWADKVRHLIES